MLTLQRLDITDANALIGAARAAAQGIAVPMCIAVTDEAGNLIAFERMDGAKIPSVQIAIDKAFTAAGIRKGTDVLGEASQPGKPVFGISSTLGGRMTTIAGGLPVIVEGATIGAIGISSGSPDQDLHVAQAALQFFQCKNEL